MYEDNRLHVMLQDEEGDLLELVMDPYSTVGDLKSRIAQIYQVPPMCQRLAMGTRELLDNKYEELIVHCPHGVKTFSVHLSITLDEATQGLEHPVREQKLNALQALAELGFGACGHHAVSSMGTRLDRQDDESRQPALRALAHMAERGQTRAVVELTSRLEDWEHDLRRAAVEALTQVAEPGNEQAIDLLLPRLKDVSIEVRLAVLEALPRAAGYGDARCITGAGFLLEDSVQYVRRAALKALSQLAEKGNDMVFAEVQSRLGHADPEVRATALKALPHILEQGDERGVTAVIDRLEDPVFNVRRTALETLGLVARHGDQSTIISLCNRLGSNMEEIRITMAQALTQVVNYGDKATVLTLSQRLQDGSVDVKLAVIHALTHAVSSQSEGHGMATAALCERCEDPDRHVRRAALEALPKIAPPEDKHATEAAETCLQDEDAEVFRLAHAALEKLGGSQTVLQEAVCNLEGTAS